MSINEAQGTGSTDLVNSLYEQAKRVLRGSLGEGIVDGHNFLLACHDCGLAFPYGAEMAMLAQHAELSHGFKGEGKLPLDLVYIGEGMPPKARPS